ncbi:MAG: cation transporter [Alphaproteobacteria bacterium]|nr:cation transporter [Alphaproteobacteria bacterium]
MTPPHDHDHDHDHDPHGHDHGHGDHTHAAQAHGDHAHGDHAHHDHAHHDHGHDHHHGLGHHHHGAPGSLGTAFALNLGFTLVELVGAWLTNSTAIAADAVHDLGDSLALAFAWVMERTADAPPTSRYTFGFRRLTAAGALVNAGVIAGGSCLVVLEAVPRLWDPVEPHTGGMIALAVMGVAINGIAAWRVHDGGTSLNSKVVTWHLLEDVLGWVAVLVGALVMQVADVPVLDPLLSVGIAVFVSVNALRHGRAAAEVLLQATPPGLDSDTVRGELNTEPAIQEVRHFHLWSQDGENHVVTAELVVDGGLSLAELSPIRERLRARLATHGVNHATLEFSLATAGRSDCGAP